LGEFCESQQFANFFSPIFLFLYHEARATTLGALYFVLRKDRGTDIDIAEVQSLSNHSLLITTGYRFYSAPRLLSHGQTLSSQGAYRLEIISALSERVWSIAYTFFVLEYTDFVYVDRSGRL